MQRRRFFYWMSAGLFGLGESLGIEAFDRLAAAAMNFRSGSSRSGSSGTYAHSSKAIGYGQANRSNASSSYNGSLIPAGPVVDVPDDPTYEGKIDPKRAARHGRAPSRWLRSLAAEELREWLKTVNPPHTGVVGNQFALHLTRDHLFVADRVAGLTMQEQAKLHSAAHAGY
jgi:hypothetical protein